MARAHTPVIPAKMYRHFAAVTIALTAMLAFFADGENRQAAAQSSAARHEQDAVRRHRRASVLHVSPTVGHFSEDSGFGGDFGSAMETLSGGPRRSAVSDPVGSLLQAGYTKAYLDSLSPEERERLLARLRGAGPAGDEDRRQQAAALSAASALRSGAAPGGE